MLILNWTQVWLWILWASCVARSSAKPRWDVLVEADHDEDHAERPNIHNSPAIKELRIMRDRSPDGILEIDQSFVEDFLLTSPRQFHLIMMITAPEDVCASCRIASTALARLAKGLHHREITSTDGAPVFIGRLMATSHREVARKFRITEVPLTYLLGPDSLTYYQRSQEIDGPKDWHEITRIDCNKRDKMLIRAENEYFKDLVMKIEERIGKQDESFWKEQPSLLRRVQIGSIMAFGLAAFLVAILWGRELVIKFPKIKPIVAMLVYAINSGGLIFSIQHGVPFFGRKGDSLEYINLSGRSQYMGEGLMMAVIACLCGLSLYAASTAPRWKLWASGKWGNDSQKQGSMCMILCVGMSLALYFCLVTVFLAKNPYVHPTFFPSEDYGTLRMDRGYMDSNK